MGQGWGSGCGERWCQGVVRGRVRVRWGVDHAWVGSDRGGVRQGWGGFRYRWGLGWHQG